MSTIAYTDADLIAFTERRYRYGGQQLTALRREFDLNGTQFWQQVNQLLDDPQRIATLPRELWPAVKRLVGQRRRQLEMRTPTHRPVCPM